MAGPRRANPAGAGAADSGGRPATRVGVLGGTFNPPHRGHVALARHAMQELGLERVWLMPARLSPGKPAEDEPRPVHPEHRLEMCRLAAAEVEGVDACALEVERDGPSYTAATLRALHAAHPGIEVTFIMGADVARTLPAWHEAGELPALARFAVALRAGGPRIIEAEEVRRALAAAPPEPEARLTGAEPFGRRIRMEFLNMPTIDVSSSLVRDRVRAGLPIKGLVEPAVASYLSEHRLYRAPTGARAS
ncbi:MAG: nicotinate (nicotinamide) nucleotide adenylyltransferase [Solirubrobacteraceae bacterium]